MKNITNLINNKKFREALATAEEEIYKAAYIYSGHNQSETARLLGVARGTVITKLKSFRSTE